MKKNIGKSVVALLILSVFLMPLMGVTVLSEGRDLVITTYYFNSYDENEAWEINPQYMINGNPDTYASTTITGDVELCDDNTCIVVPAKYFILKVELRTRGCYSRSQRAIILRPVFGGTDDGENYYFYPPECPTVNWSEWFDITNDPSGPGSGRWTWQDVRGLDCDVEAGSGMVTFTLYCSIVQLRVTYTIP